jgi:hypothetical protein
MPITLITGPANAGKAHVVMDAVRRHAAHGEAPLLVVPTRADAAHYLRELAGEGAVLGVRVERFAGLIEEVARRAGLSAPVLGGLARERVLAAVLTRSSSDGRDGRVGDDGDDGGNGGGGARADGDPPAPGLVRALAGVIAELQVRRVSAARLSQAIEQWAAADAMAAPSRELGRLYADYLHTMERLGREDREQRAVRALDALHRTPVLWGHTPVLFYGFDDFTPLQLDAIETLGRVVGAPVTVSLTYEPGRTAFAGRAATFAALVPLAAEHRRLAARADYYAPRARAALSHLERSLFEPDAARVDPAGAVRLLEGGGERAELELVAREVRALLAEGMAPEEVAVVVRTSTLTAELLEEVFSAAEIPYSLRRRARFADTAIGRALIGLLRCVPGSAATANATTPNAATADGKTAGLGGALGGEEATAGKVEHLLAWLRAPGLLERPQLADSLELAVRRTGATSAARARALWQEHHWPLDTIEQLAEAERRGPMALIDRCERELQWLFYAPRRGRASVLAGEEMDDARALAAGRRALGELRDLARLAPDLAPGEAAELAHLLERVEILGERGGTPSAGAVAVLDPLALRARRVRALFVCGLQEGAFPARARPQPFLADQERRRLAETSDLMLGEHDDRSNLGQLAPERYLLYAAVSRPEELLVLSWHVADDDGEPTARSLFVEDICDLFEEGFIERRARRPLGAVDAPASGDVLASGDAPRVPVRGSERLRDKRLLVQLSGHVWSASSLEAWIGCPVRWFVERMLRPGAIEPDPEPFARGGLAHAALRDTLEGLRRETGSARLEPASLELARALLRTALSENERDFPLSVAPERVPGVRRRLQVDLERYLEHAAALASPLEPLALELGFGFADDDPGSVLAGERGEASDLPALELGGGVRLRGRIDRVDVSGSGEAVVYDYKGARAPASARWIRDGSVQVALYMRAVESLLHLSAVGGFYQPLTGTDLRARGMVDGDAGIEIEYVRSDLLEHDQARALLERAVAMAREAAGEAARGELQARPQTCAFRGGCMYPSICRCEL